MLDTLRGPALIARTILDGPAGARHTKKMLRKAFQCQLDGKGFSLIEVLSPCPVYMRLDPKDAMDHVRNVVADYFPVKVLRDRTGAGDQE